MGSKNLKGPWRCSGPAVLVLELGSCLGVKGPVAVTKDSHFSTDLSGAAMADTG